MTTTQRRQDALDYLGERTGTLEYRFQRYGAVADEMFARGLDDSCIIADIGAGMGDFAFYLRAVRGFKGRYLPVDASIDGTDFEEGWRPHAQFDFVVAIELIEHVLGAEQLIFDMKKRATRAVIITTPNTDKLGEEFVRAQDRTHVRPFWRSELEHLGFAVRIASFFGKPEDSMLAVHDV